jgi:transcriptional regulator with XRE-family HTH domain
MKSAKKRYSRHEKFMKAFGKNLAAIRKKQDVTQEELCYRTDLFLSQIGRIERGEINTSISIVSKIAKALKIHPKELFDF